MLSEMRGYDSWLEAPYQRGYSREHPVGEHYLGCRVVVGTNKWGLGRWGTINNYFVEVEQDEGGTYDDVYFEVTFSDGENPCTETIDQYEAERQLGARR